MHEASKQPSEITIVDSDGPDDNNDDDDDDKNGPADDDEEEDDDDVQFITKTFDPTIAAKRQAHVQQMQQRSPGRLINFQFNINFVLFSMYSCFLYMCFSLSEFKQF